MDKVAARKLVKDTFERPFDEPRFTYFAKNLFQSLDQTRLFTCQGNTVPKAYHDYINSLERVGEYVDSDQKKIDTLIVRLKKETSLERARTMQRNFIAWYLNGSRDYKDAVVVAFLSPDEDDWRFSLVKMEYILDDKGKPKPELTPARRWSFLVGAQENSHTAQSQLEKVLENEERLTLARLEDAFNVEVVTREFFTKYRELFNDVNEALEGVTNQNLKAREDFEAKGIDPVNFAKKLLGQVVFLYFLQKKGWFGVGRDENWGTGPKDFLRRLFEKEIVSYVNFFNDVLEPLFYEALAVERTDDFYSHFNCKIPFLNGGLFDPINNYDWVHTDILLPNKLFSNKKETKDGDTGTGILDVFDRYNFTVKEDEPLDKEVAVDPEMLGKVFENLLEVKDRKSKGTYYTPREIVHYMCQESLINYLDTILNTGEVAIVKEKSTNLKLFGAPAFQQQALKTPGYTNRVLREDIEAFVHVGDAAIEHDLAALQNLDKIEQGVQKTTKYLKLRSIQENASLIDNALASIRVCDPAIGSGAFPVGLMAEIVRARNTLTTYLPDKTGRTNYNFKRHAIQNCLYGVDIDPGAVEIAKLRLWLSLVVDEEDIKQIQPLPNLDYKIVCGNSLLGVERRIENWPLYAELERLKPLHFEETNAKKKQEYKRQIDQLIMQLTDNKKTFDFEIYFSEVFHEKVGFDVVIANPPYLSAWTMEKQNPEDRDKMTKIFKGYEVLTGHWDLYMAFVLQGHDMLRKSGVLSYILPNPVLREKYATALRKFLLKTMMVDSLLIFDESNVFENVSRKTAVFVIRNDPTQQYSVKIWKNSSWKEDHSGIRYCTNIDKDAWLNSYQCRFRADIDDRQEKLIDKIDKMSIKVGNICYVNYGAQVSSKVKGAFKKSDMVCHSPVGNAKKFYEGKDLHRWSLRWRGLWLNYQKNEIYGPRTEEFFENPKIAIRKVSDKHHSMGGSLDKTGMYCDDGIVLITPYSTLEKTDLNKGFLGYERISAEISIEYLTAHILSSLSNLYYRCKFATESLQQATSHVYPQAVRALPVRNVSLKSQQPFVDLVNQIHAITKDEDYLSNSTKQTKVRALERQIDQMVYELYGLTPEEIAVVEGENV